MTRWALISVIYEGVFCKALDVFKQCVKHPRIFLVWEKFFYNDMIYFSDKYL